MITRQNACIQFQILDLYRNIIMRELQIVGL